VCATRKEAEESLKKFRKSKTAWKNFLESQENVRPETTPVPTTSGSPDVSSLKKRIEELEEKNSKFESGTNFKFALFKQDLNVCYSILADDLHSENKKLKAKLKQCTDLKDAITGLDNRKARTEGQNPWIPAVFF
jgi:hypothetical protein